LAALAIHGVEVLASDEARLWEYDDPVVPPNSHNLRRSTSAHTLCECVVQRHNSISAAALEFPPDLEQQPAKGRSIQRLLMPARWCGRH
jgi:hypothetical protein